MGSSPHGTPNGIRTRDLSVPKAAGFLTYNHAEDPADIVYSRYALHHLPDLWKVMALRRVRALLPLGGILRLWDIAYHFNPDEVNERVEAWCAPHGEQLDGDWARWEMEEHVRDEHSTSYAGRSPLAGWRIRRPGAWSLARERRGLLDGQALNSESGFRS